MRVWLAALLALIFSIALPAAQPRLVPDVSEREVNIQYSFTGARLLLFGAVIYPDGRPADSRVDIAVVLKGPPQSMVIREKQKVWGMWVNADSTRLASVPGFYSVASTRPIKAMLDARTSAIYELGLSNIHLSPGEPDASLARFEAGLRDLRQRQGLFAAHPGTVEIVDGSLYRARLPIPARVPVGTYTAETFLIQNGRIIAAATRKIDIRKSGFEKFVADAAEANPIAYGLVAILMSIALGWLAGVLFKKD